MNSALAFGLTGNMFHAHPEEWEWMETYYLRFRKAPSKLAFKNKFPDFMIKPADDTKHFADEVRKSHSRHMLTNTMSDCADMIAEGKIDSAVALVHAQIVTVAAALGTANDTDIFNSYDDILSDVVRRVDRVEEHGTAGIPTGFISLDERTGGPQPGDSWIIGARLGEGKSWTMQAMATAAVMAGYTVQFDALEQSRAQVAMRIHAFMSSEVGQNIFETTNLMQGKNFDLREYRKFLKDLKTTMKGRLHVSDTSRGRVGLLTIASQIERNNPDIVFIDYLTLMDKQGGEWQDVAALSAGVKQLATEYTLPIVSAAQLNREHGLSKEPPGPEALARADAIGQDADGVITMKQMSASTIMMKMAKNRNGAGGFKWYTHFKPSAGVFKEVSYEKFLSLRDDDAAAADGGK